MSLFTRRSALLGLGTLGLSALALPLLNGTVEANPKSGTQLPEFEGISSWLNSEPLRIRDLKGKVIAVQFWTLGCINCQRTLPSMVALHKKYSAQGLVIVGVHTPEFEFERDLNKLKSTLKLRDIEYAVAVDNRSATWRAYQNEYWPHLFVSDRQGRLRYDHIGEGAYDQTDRTIQKLLSERA